MQSDQSELLTSLPIHGPSALSLAARSFFVVSANTSEGMPWGDRLGYVIEIHDH